MANLVEKTNEYNHYKVINIGQTYSTYNIFAKNYGYPDAAASLGSGDIYFKKIRQAVNKNNCFIKIAEGEHSIPSHGTLYILESLDKNIRFIINKKGVEKI